MVLERLLGVTVHAEALVALVVIYAHCLARPAMALDTEVVIAL